MSSDLTAQIHHYLTHAPSSLFAQQEVAMLDAWEGDANLLWRVRMGGDEAVVKLFLDAGQARSRRQFDGHSIFAPRGLAPEPLWADRYPHGLSRQLIVYRWIEGESIDLADANAVTAWAEAIATLHATPTDDVRRFSPHPVNLDFYWRIEQGSIAQIRAWLATSGIALQDWSEQLTKATEALVERQLPLWSRAAPTPTHGDLSAAHTLLERGRVALLDWEMFGLGDPALDVARLLQRDEQMFAPHLLDLWLDRYLQRVEIPEMSERVDTFRRLLEVHNVIYLLVGLQQHTTAQVDQALQDALPFLQAALATALGRATSALALTSVHDAHEVAAEFIAWLIGKPPQAQ